MTLVTTEPTTLTENELKFAHALFDAYQTRKPLTEKDWQDTVTTDERAYAVQDKLTALKREAVGGYKVSLTSAKTQAMFAATSPLYGAQVKSHFLTSPATVSLQTLMEPLVEVELAFEATADLLPTDSLSDLMAKTNVAGALELPDSRFADWFPQLSKYMVMADAAVGGLVVYSQPRPTTSLFKDVDQVAKVACELTHDNETVASGQASEVLGNPLNSLHWLVAQLADQGKTFKAGQMVSAGTFVLPPALTSGTWHVDFTHGLASVTVTVTA